jgi:hypothetical protein
MGTLRRFSPRDNARLKRWYAAYMPVSEIARRLQRSEGVIRATVFYRRLRRSSSVSWCLKWAPAHLKLQLRELGPVAFCNACHVWRERQRLEGRAAEAARLAEACDLIDKDPSLGRDDKMRAKRRAGMTLQL